MKKSVLAVICVTSCMALSCGFDLEIEKEVTDCFAWGGGIEKGRGCLMDETVCTERGGLFTNGKCNIAECFNYGGEFIDGNCSFKDNICQNINDKDKDNVKDEDEDGIDCQEVATCIMQGGVMNGTSCSLEDECRTLGGVYEHSDASCTMTNKLQDVLKDCTQNEQVEGKIQNAIIVLNGETKIDAALFGKCDLINSGLKGEGPSKAVIMLKDADSKTIYPLFKSIKNSTIENIELRYDVNDEMGRNSEWSKEGATDVSDGKGIFARVISNSQLSDIEIHGNLKIINKNADDFYDEKNIGALAGVVFNSRLNRIAFHGTIHLDLNKYGDKPIDIYNVGGLIGQVVIGNCGDENKECWMMDKITVDNDSNERNPFMRISAPKARKIENIGGLVGYVRSLDEKAADEVRKFSDNDVLGEILINTESDDVSKEQELRYLGGQFGKIETFDGNSSKTMADFKQSPEISSSKFMGCFQVKTGAAYGVGGLIGRAEYSAIFNSSSLISDKCGGIDILSTGLVTDSDETYSLANIGGFAGRLDKSSLKHVTTEMSMTLKGQSLNRIGGIGGASWLNQFTDVGFNEAEDLPSMDIEVASEDTPSIKYLGGFAGKSYYSVYDDTHVSLNAEIKMKEGATCQQNESIVSHVGNLFGESLEDTLAGKALSCQVVSKDSDLAKPEHLKLPDDCNNYQYTVCE